MLRGRSFVISATFGGGGVNQICHLLTGGLQKSDLLLIDADVGGCPKQLMQNDISDKKKIEVNGSNREIKQ